MQQLNQLDVKQYRKEILELQGGICPILQEEIQEGYACLDHAHEDSLYSETQKGQIRGVLNRYANSLEGSMRARFKRSGLSNIITFEEFLINLYTYLVDHRYPLLHPSNKPRTRKLQKRSYQELKREINEVNKYLDKPIKMPDFPKSGRLTKRLKELYHRFGLTPKFYAKGHK